MEAISLQGYLWGSNQGNHDKVNLPQGLIFESNQGQMMAV